MGRRVDGGLVQRLTRARVSLWLPGGLLRVVEPVETDDSTTMVSRRAPTRLWPRACRTIRTPHSSMPRASHRQQPASAKPRREAAPRQVSSHLSKRRQFPYMFQTILLHASLTCGVVRGRGQISRAAFVLAASASARRPRLRGVPMARRTCTRLGKAWWSCAAQQRDDVPRRPVSSIRPARFVSSPPRPNHSSRSSIRLIWDLLIDRPSQAAGNVMNMAALRCRTARPVAGPCRGSAYLPDVECIRTYTALV